MQNKLNKIVKLVNKHFEYPTVCNLYEELLSDKTSNAEDFAQMLSIDPITSATVIKIANSAVFGMKGQVSNLSKAIFIVGIKHIGDILYVDMAKRMSVTFKLSDEKLMYFWRRSLMIAFLSKQLGKATKAKDKELLFVTGLLSLIGEVPLLYLQGGKWSPLLKNSNLPWVDHKEKNGFASNELSVEILNSWDFPQKNIIPIKHAHIEQPVGLNKNAQIVQASFMLSLPYTFVDKFIFSDIISDKRISSLGIASHDLKLIYSHCIDLTEQMISLVVSTRQKAC